MPLSSIRNMLVEATGRQDLLDAGMAVGADTLINEGQKLLDRKLDGSKSGARYPIDISAGDLLIPVPYCRAIKKVFVHSSTERAELVKQDVHVLREEYSSATSLITRGQPLYYSPINIRPFPELIDTSLFNQPWLFNDLMTSGHYYFNGLLLMPPADANYTLDIWGLFYSDVLVNDADESYWTEVHPLLLVNAAMYRLECIYRNTEGQRDLMASIELDLMDITKDVIEEDAEGRSVMEG